MYFPILRGRQFELLALQECLNYNLLCDKIIPVIEPVKCSSTYVRTVDAFINNKHPIAIIRNPQVGSWTKESRSSGNQPIVVSAKAQLNEPNVISSLYVTPQIDQFLNTVAAENGISVGNMLLICNKQENIPSYLRAASDIKPRFCVIPDKRDFRRAIRDNRVLCEDHFPKRPRNVDYLENETEFFSSDHLFYSEDGYIGFSDYSIIGEEYNDAGFAPYAVAIHIVYFDEGNVLNIKHFVSDSNDDFSDPARKFSEAVEKLVIWNQHMELKTAGIQAFEKEFFNRTYPGLGVVKKYSLMHHLELMSNFLDGARR